MYVYIQSNRLSRSARMVAALAVTAAATLSAASAQSNVRTWHASEHPAVTCAEGVASTTDSDAHLLRTCHKALALHGNSRTIEARTLVNTGILEMRRGDAAEALHLFEKAKHVDPALPDIRINIAAARIRNGQYEAALHTLSDIATIAEAQRHEAYFNRGLAHWHLGTFDAAYRDFLEAQRLSPDYQPALEMLSHFTFVPVQQTERGGTPASG